VVGECPNTRRPQNHPYSILRRRADDKRLRDRRKTRLWIIGIAIHFVM